MWIDVHDRLPSENEEVIVADKWGKVLFARHIRIHGEKWEWDNDEYGIVGAVTHWQPKPVAPCDEIDTVIAINGVPIPWTSSRQKRVEPCDYCKNTDYLKRNLTFVDRYYEQNVEPEYCPNCGRRLE